MKTVNIISFILLAMFLSCNNPSGQTQRLIGNVYQSSDGMDSICKSIEKGTDHYQTILFINDSIFVKIINTCCGDEGDTTDFAAEFYYAGIYKMDDKELNLRYNPQQIVFYIDNANPSLTHSEIEKSDLINSKFERENCKDIPYFKQTDGEFNRNEFVSPIEDTLENYKEELIKKGIWEKLFR